MSKVKLARYRNTDYSVRYTGGSVERQWNWSASKGDKIDTKEIPLEAVEWLQMNSICFDQGELVIVENPKAEISIEEVKEGIVEPEVYADNTHTQEEILKILGGNINKMKSELKKITVDSEIRFVLDVAETIKDDLTKGKIDFLSEWAKVDVEVIFA